MTPTRAFQPLASYRRSGPERQRERNLMSLVGSGETALDIGARDGHYSRLLCSRYSSVTALDLEMPQIAGCVNVAGDVRAMAFPDRRFDLVFCAEVLEHVPEVERAASEIIRIARNRIVIGVPYRQDTRVGRVTCQQCGFIGPPWGHVNRFDEARLTHLFAGCRVISMHYVGQTNASTTAVARLLMDLAGNPWGTYDQQEPCRCGARFQAPKQRNPAQKAAGAAAHVLNRLTVAMRRPHANWIHVVFAR